MSDWKSCVANKKALEDSLAQPINGIKQALHHYIKIQVCCLMYGVDSSDKVPIDEIIDLLDVERKALKCLDKLHALFFTKDEEID